MGGPWEEYQSGAAESPPAETGPWADYDRRKPETQRGATRTWESEEPLSANRINQAIAKRAAYVAQLTTDAPVDETLYKTFKSAPIRAFNIVGKGGAGLVNDLGMQAIESAYGLLPLTFREGVAGLGRELMDTPPVGSDETIGQSINYAPGRAIKAIGEGYGMFKKAFPGGAEMAESAANIAGATPVLRGIGKTGEVIAEAGKLSGKAVANIAGDIISEVTRKTPEALDKKLGDIVAKGIDKGIRPTVVGKGNIAQINAYRERAKTAVKEIIGNKDNLILTDAEGNIIQGQLPKSLKQFSESIDQTKKGIFTKYDNLQREAGAQGATVDLSGVVKELEDIAGKTTLQDLSPGVAGYAETRAAALAERGVYSTAEAQEAIAQLNKSLEAFYKNPSYENATKAGIDAVIANNLRKSLDAVIENATGGGYQELKRAYGALKSIEKETAHRAVVDARKNIKGLLDFSDIFTSSELIAGLAVMNPGMIVRGATARGLKTWWKAINDPNRIIRNMFSDAENVINSGKPRVSPYGPKAAPEGPWAEYNTRGLGFNSREDGTKRIGYEPLPPESDIIDASYVDIPPQPQLPGPQRMLPPPGEPPAMSAPDIPPAPEPPAPPPSQPAGVKAKAAPRAKGPENLVTYLQKNGYVRLDEYADKTGDSWSRAHGVRSKDRSREMGDIADVSRREGRMSLDDAAANLNSEGWPNPSGGEWTADDLFDVLSQKGQGRKIFTPDKADAIMERKIRQEEAKYYADIEAGFETEGIDAGEIGKSSQNLNAGISEALRAEGIDLPQEIIDAELDDYFSALAKKHNVKSKLTNETGNLAGFSPAETFSLANPETEIARGLLSKKDMTPTHSILTGMSGRKK